MNEGGELWSDDVYFSVKDQQDSQPCWTECERKRRSKVIPLLLFPPWLHILGNMVARQRHLYAWDGGFTKVLEKQLWPVGG